MSADRSGIDDLRPLVETALEQACRFEDGCPKSLSEAIRYALLAPGKRLRPLLVLMASEACGGTPSSALPAAVAVEMIHAYSLIHDDLPAMDDDDLRRGRPTVHIQFGEATAILAGDALIAQAFLHLCREIADPNQASEAVAVLSLAAGPSRLVGGQADDLAAESRLKQLSDRLNPQAPKASREATTSELLEQLESIHRRKTGALFSACLELGGILAAAGPQHRAALRNYARDLGLAFQVVDDILDFTADDETLGKRAGKDLDRGKLTYPRLMGIEAAREKATQLVESAQAQLGVFGSSGWRLGWMARYVLDRTH